MINVRQAILVAAVFPFLAACGGAPDGVFSSEDAGGSLLFPDGGSRSDSGAIDRDAADSGDRAVDSGSPAVDGGRETVDSGNPMVDGSTLLCCTSDQASTRACGAGIEWFCSPPDGGAVEAVVCGSCTTLGQMCAVSNAPDAPLGVVGTIEPCK
jgi:hypothetical protein